MYVATPRKLIVKCKSGNHERIDLFQAKRVALCLVPQRGKQSEREIERRETRESGMSKADFDVVRMVNDRTREDKSRQGIPRADDAGFEITGSVNRAGITRVYRVLFAVKRLLARTGGADCFHGNRRERAKERERDSELNFKRERDCCTRALASRFRRRADPASAKHNARRVCPGQLLFLRVLYAVVKSADTVSENYRSAANG